MNVLIVKLSAIGDVTHTLAALTALRRAHPQAHIAWLVEESAEAVVSGHPALNRVLVWRRREFMRLTRSAHLFRAARLLWRFLRELRDTRYELVLDFQALLKSGLWILASRADRKVGFGRGLDHAEGSHLFLNERVPAVSMEIHALERGLLLLEGIGIARGPVRYDFPITPAARQCVGTLLREQGVDGAAPLVAMHPMTRWPTKHWPAQRFAELADALSREGHRVVFTGAAQDRPAIDGIFQCLREPAIRLDGRLDLKELAALFERTRVVISTDTGPMHIAAAVGTPVVAVFGPTSPQRTGPYGQEHVVLRCGVACSPCFSRRCRSSVAEPMACMNRITVQEVVAATRRVLESSARLVAGPAQETPKAPR